MSDGSCNGLDCLDSSRTSTNDTDSLAYKSRGVAWPTCRMPGLAFEVLDTGNVRHGWLVQDAHGGDEISAGIFTASLIN